MKNNASAPQKSSPEKLKSWVVVAASIFLVICLAIFFVRSTNHTRELVYAIASHDHARLEQLLKNHPGLIDAKIANRSPKNWWNPLHMAACFGDTEAVEILTHHRARVNVQDDSGLTPLHYCVAQGRYDAAQMLINKGADMNAKGRDGRTPLDLAKNLRDRRLIEMFQIRGARE